MSFLIPARKGGERPIKIPEEILTTAKEAVFKFGGFQPVLFVDGTKRRIYLPLPFGESSDERVAIMTEAGMQLAKAGNIGDVERVIFVSEAWVSPARARYTAPSQDPDRQEVLMFNVLDAKTGVQGLEIYACVRNGRKDIIDLKPVPINGAGTTEVGGRLLPAFLAGFRLFKR